MRYNTLPTQMSFSLVAAFPASLYFLFCFIFILSFYLPSLFFFLSLFCLSPRLPPSLSYSLYLFFILLSHSLPPLSTSLYHVMSLSIHLSEPLQLHAGETLDSRVEGAMAAVYEECKSTARYLLPLVAINIISLPLYCTSLSLFSLTSYIFATLRLPCNHNLFVELSVI